MPRGRVCRRSWRASERGIGGAAEGAEHALEAAVGEPQGRADVGADARRADYVEVLDPLVTPGVGDHTGQGALPWPRPAPTPRSQLRARGISANPASSAAFVFSSQIRIV